MKTRGLSEKEQWLSRGVLLYHQATLDFSLGLIRNLPVEVATRRIFGRLRGQRSTP